MKDRDDKVDGAAFGGDGQEEERERVKVHSQARRVSLRSKRWVSEPSRMRRLSDQRAPVEKQARKEERPVSEGVEARKSQVAGADHQRDEVDGKSGENRRSVPENHGERVHGEELVVLFGSQQGGLGMRQLEA